MSFLDIFRQIMNGGTTMPLRSALNFIGTTVLDNQANNSTDVYVTSGANASANSIAAPVTNSLCLRSLADEQWAISSSPFSSATPCRLNDQQDNAPYADSILLNPNANASLDQRTWRVCAPPGASSLTFSITAKLPTGVLSSTMAIAWFNASISVQLAIQSVVLTGAYVTYAVTLSGVVPGTEYVAFATCSRVSMGTSAQAQAEVAGVAITAPGATGILSSNFTRLHLYPQLLTDNVEGPRNSTYESGLTERGYRHSAFARVVVDTNAAQLLVELWNGVFSTYPNSANLAVYVNGRYFQTIPGQGTNTTGTLYYALVDLSSITTAGSATNRVEIVAGANVDFAPPPAGTAGSFMRAIYVASTSSASIVVASPKREILIVTDSVGLGFKTTNDQAKAWGPQLRYQYPGRVVFDGAGIRSLFYANGNGTGNTAAGRQALAQRLAQRGPAELWFELGINDWRGSYWANAGAFGTAVTDFFNKFHAASPATQIYIQLPTFQIGSDVGMDAYRAQLALYGWSNSTFCTVVYGQQYVGAPGDYDADNLHMTNQGDAKLLQAFLGSLGYGPTSTSVFVPKNGLYTYTTATLWEGWESQDVAPGAVANWPGHFNAIALTQGTGANQPTMTAGLGPQGLTQACNFSAASHLLQTSAQTLSSPCTIFAVYYPNQVIGVAGSNDSVFDGRTNQSAWLVNTSDIHLFCSTLGTNFSASFQAAQGHWAILTVVINGASSAISDIDDTAAYNRATGLNAGAATNMAGYTMGNVSGGGRSQRGYHAAHYVFTGAMSAQEQVYFIDGYIKPTWNMI